MSSTKRYERNVFSQPPRRGYYEHDERTYSSAVSNAPRYPRSRPGYRNRQGTVWHKDSRNYNAPEGSWRGGRHQGEGAAVSFSSSRFMNRYANDGETSSGGNADGRSRHQAMYLERFDAGRHRKKWIRRNNDKYLLGRNVGWHKIIIQDGSVHNKAEVLTAIKDVVDEPFTPIMFETEGNNLVFYVENNGSAVSAIEKVGRRVRLNSSNTKLSIRTNQSAPPIRTLTPEQSEIVKQVMSNRYSVEMSRLDLKNLHNDIQLTSQNIFCPLNRRPNMQMITTLITEHVKAVQEIDLGFNKIFILDDLASLTTSCPNLRRLSLEKNKIPSVGALDKLKGLAITELTLKDNPLCDKFKDTESYISAVRQRFPKVLYLDGQELPKPVMFELDEEPSKLPDVKGSYFCNDQAKSVVSEFLLQYYQIFDSGNRRPLEAAYTEDAVFSLSVSFPETGPSARFTVPYLQENRNLMKFNDCDRRQDKLVKTRSKITDILCKLPNMSHDLTSFVVDIPIAEPQLVKVVLTGVFKQIADKNPPIRSFMRSFIIVPVGNGFCISNELLFISIATFEQVKRAFKLKSQDARASASTTSTTPTPTPTMPAVSEEQMKLIQDFCLQTGMVPIYSGMCLEQNNWDYNKAAEMFVQLKAENKIPPEYFRS